MAYPAGSPVKERVLEHVKTTLAAIASPAYFTDVVAVKRQTSENPYVALDQAEFPAVLISVPTTSYDDGVNGILSASTNVSLRLVVQAREGVSSNIEQFISDVKAALLADWTRGGLALDTKIVGDEVLVPEEVTGYAVADVSLTLRWRHLYSDPNTAA